MRRHQAFALASVRLKVEYDKLISNFAFNFNLRRYKEEAMLAKLRDSTMVRRCRLTM